MLIRFMLPSAVLLLGLFHQSALGNLRFRVDENVFGGVRLTYNNGDGFDFTPYRTVDIVFDDLQLNDGSLVVEAQHLWRTVPDLDSANAVNTRSRTTTSDGPQVVSVPLPSSFRPPDFFAINFGSVDLFSVGIASNLAGEVSEIRLSPLDQTASTQLIDDFSGPYFSASRSDPGPTVDGHIANRTGESDLQQVGIDPASVLGGERSTLAFMRQILEPGVGKVSFEIDGDGTGSAPAVPEPSSLYIWMLTVVMVAGGGALRWRRFRC